MVDDPLVGRQVGSFHIEYVIGRGGMATVYLGTDIRLQRPAAIKVLDSRYRDDVGYAQRFVREARSVASWHHENIVQIYSADESDGLFFFAMEYIDGKDLGRLIKEYAAQHRRLPDADVLRIAQAVASALDYAHQRGVVHRDVKPSNVLIARDGRIVLADFGLVLDVEQGSLGDVFGSAHYVAPEQARRSSAAVPQSDLYSLGVILYELLTGRVPFDDPSPTSVAIQHITQPPPEPRSLNPDLSEAIQAVLLKALSKSSQERYQSGSELVAALQQAFAAEQNTAPDLLPLPNMLASLESAPLVGAPPLGPPGPQTAQPGRHPLRAPPSASVLWAAGGCSLALVFVVTLGSLAAFKLRAAPPASATLGASTEATAFGILPPRSTVTPAPTDQPASPSPSSTALPTATTTPLPTRTATVRPTVAATASAVPSQAQPAATPTVKYPNGHHFTLFYNDNSLYMLNQSSSVISIYPFAFERLSTGGQVLNRFDGWRWGQFYPTTKPGWCDQILIIDSRPYLNPAQCQNRALSTRTPVRGDPVIFWTAQPGSVQFRVIWKNGTSEEELARCSISASPCDFYTP